jgi:PPOX class probable F420-dependent enzyme
MRARRCATRPRGWPLRDADRRAAQRPRLPSRVVSRRDQIRMGDAELAAFLDEQQTVVVATNGRDGWPHLMPLWYMVRDGELWSWTYARSQKVRNLERDARATLQVEAGEQYDELRGVMLRTEVVLHRDLETVSAFGAELFERYTGASPLPAEARAMVDAQAPKRVALQFVPVAPPVTWDHGKLGGVY